MGMAEGVCLCPALGHLARMADHYFYCTYCLGYSYCLPLGHLIVFTFLYILLFFRTIDGLDLASRTFHVVQ